jgi:hypothetical protein
MVMVEIDSNAILVKPMKSRKDQEMIRAYDALVKRLQRAGVQPKKHVLDNEISENMKEHIRDKCKFKLELVPPGCHRKNAAEVGIRNFKAHTLSVMAGVADNFLPSLWDRLLPQTEITLNLLANPMPPQPSPLMPISTDPSTTTKCRLRQWVVRSKCMKKRTNMELGLTIVWKDGTSTPPLSTIESTGATSRPPKATVCLIQYSSNTNPSQIQASLQQTN